MAANSGYRPGLSLYIAWTVAALATAASIYFIEIVGNPAAPLCWIERMMMFGTLLVLSTGLVLKDWRVWRYALPFVLVGIPAALYQQLVHWDVIGAGTQACSANFVCTTKFFNLFGFITQATLCLAAFTIISVCLWRLAKTTK